MAIESAELDDDVNQTKSDSDDNRAVFQWWKFLMMVLAGVGAFFNSLVTTQSFGHATGYAAGQAVMIGLVLIISTKLARRFGWFQADTIRPNLYIGVCLLSALAGAAAGLLGLHLPMFILVYVVLIITAVIVETLVGINSPRSTSN